jgi:hypothetical protein
MKQLREVSSISWGDSLFKSVYSDHEVEIECFMGLTERL